MTTILDGKALSQKIQEELAQKIAKLDKKPGLAVILVGEDPASQLYVSMKEKTAIKLGINSVVIKLPKNTEETALLNKIEELNKNPEIHGILVQIPLPKHISEQKVMQTIYPQKDVDGILPENIGRISTGMQPFAYPCTPKGIVKLLDEYKIEISGKHAVVIGRSNIVGKPIALMLLNRNATVTICHSKTENLAEITKTADIVISAVGKNKIIRKEMIKPGAVIIDVGTSKINGKTCGDVDFENVKDVASFITPVPGGIGPMTIACLMENVLELAAN